MALMYDPGQYWGKVTSHKMGKAKTGTPQFILQFELIGIMDPKNPDGELHYCPVAERTVFRAITEKTIEWVLKDLELLGFTGDSFRLLDMDEGSFNCIGQELAFYCEHKAGQDGKLKTILQIAGITFLLLHYAYPIDFGFMSFEYDSNKVGTALLYLSLVFSIWSAWTYFADFLKAVYRPGQGP